MHKSRFTDSQIKAILKLVKFGLSESRVPGGNLSSGIEA